MKLNEITTPSRTVYVIRNVDTGEFAFSGKHAYFGSFSSAALYHQEKNAQAVIKKIKNTNSGNPKFDNALKELNLEVVACKLSIL
jgi:hypothetical protein